MKPKQPLANYSGGLDVNPGKWMQRLCVGTPMTGLVRAEWCFARWGAVIPCNWSVADVSQMVSPYIPLHYQVPDAENLIVKTVVEQGFQWLLSLEHDNIIPANLFTALNEYMIDEDVPVVSGLYFTKSEPSEPLVYRGQGTGYYADWKMGDKVWASGIPMGCTLIHASLLRAMWAESPEYRCGNTITRRVFETPVNSGVDPEKNFFWKAGGTSDLEWCKRVIEGDYFTKAGWPKYAKMEYPFLVDTNIFCKHITEAGIQYPLQIPPRFLPSKNGHK